MKGPNPTSCPICRMLYNLFLVSDSLQDGAYMPQILAGAPNQNYRSYMKIASYYLDSFEFSTDRNLM